MSSPVICPTHGMVFYVSSSPTLAKAISEGSLQKDCRIAILEVDSTDELGKIQKYKVDFAFLEKFSLYPIDGFLRLKDRSKKEKLMNDRSIIRKIFSETVRVCPRCLDDLVSRYRDGKYFAE
jgi:hypothetical protein